MTFTWALPAASAATAAPAAVTANGATLNGSVNPNGSAVSDCHFDLSPGNLQFPCAQQVGAGSSAVNVTAVASGLSPGTDYSYDLSVADPQGTSVATTTSFMTAAAATTTATTGGTTTVIAPANPSVLRLSGVRQSASRWREHAGPVAGGERVPVGTSFSFTLNESASVQLGFSSHASGRRVGAACLAPTPRTAHARSCTRTLGDGSLTVAAHGGLDRIAFRGLLAGGRTLAPGRYGLELRARASSTHATASLAFTIVKG